MSDYHFSFYDDMPSSSETASACDFWDAYGRREAPYFLEPTSRSPNASNTPATAMTANQQDDLHFTGTRGRNSLQPLYSSYANEQVLQPPLARNTPHPSTPPSHPVAVDTLGPAKGDRSRKGELRVQSDAMGTCGPPATTASSNMGAMPYIGGHRQTTQVQPAADASQRSMRPLVQPIGFGHGHLQQVFSAAYGPPAYYQQYIAPAPIQTAAPGPGSPTGSKGHLLATTIVQVRQPFQKSDEIVSSNAATQAREAVHNSIKGISSNVAGTDLNPGTAAQDGPEQDTPSDETTESSEEGSSTTLHSAPSTPNTNETFQAKTPVTDLVADATNAAAASQGRTPGVQGGVAVSGSTPALSSMLGKRGRSLYEGNGVASHDSTDAGSDSVAGLDGEPATKRVRKTGWRSSL
ncbi:hypothetical protein LTR08_002284 [Meristemomyces frigidus]|nr:hypothetical protein LTR08_002284 [Meristemomyces frigidus]